MKMSTPQIVALTNFFVSIFPFDGCFSDTKSFNLVHKISLGFKFGLFPGQSTFIAISVNPTSSEYFDCTLN